VFRDWTPGTHWLVGCRILSVHLPLSGVNFQGRFSRGSAGRYGACARWSAKTSGQVGRELGPGSVRSRPTQSFSSSSRGFAALSRDPGAGDGTGSIVDSARLPSRSPWRDARCRRPGFSTSLQRAVVDLSAASSAGQFRGGQGRAQFHWATIAAARSLAPRARINQCFILLAQQHQHAGSSSWSPAGCGCIVLGTGARALPGPTHPSHACWPSGATAP